MKREQIQDYSQDYDLKSSPEIDSLVKYIFNHSSFYLPEETLQGIEHLNPKLYSDLLAYRTLSDKLESFIYYYELNRLENAEKSGLEYDPLTSEISVNWDRFKELFDKNKK